MPKFAEGDTIAMRGEVARINEDGTVTVRLLRYDIPVTTRGEHLDLMAKKKPDQTTAKPRSDKLRNRAGLMRARP
jgi:hypothetical protein